MEINLKKLFTKNKSLILAYDHGLEHGVSDFDLKNIDPDYILDIAVKGKFNAVVFQPGLAEKYFQNYKRKIPLIVKLNGKTNIAQIEPVSRQNCSVKRAIKLGADAVGYTIYLGSDFENVMLAEFGKIVEEAHNFKLPVIAWIYPRGKSIGNDRSTEILAYAARTGLELGADIVKINYNHDAEGFKWVVKAAGKTKVVVAGGAKKEDNEELQSTYEIIKAGASGLAIGRGIWQHKEPLKMTKALKKIIFENKSVNEAMKVLN